MRSIKEMVTAYADLVISSGVALYQGQSLLIKTPVESYWFAQALAERAYEKGAALVRIDIDDLRLLKKRIESQDEEALTTLPDYHKTSDYEMIVKDWAFIRIDNTESRHQLVGADATKLAAYKHALSSAGKLLSATRMRHEIPWCVICVPGEVWAKDVLGPEGSVEELWSVVGPILKLDKSDPIKAWEEQSNLLKERSAKLDALNIRALNFKSKTADLRVGLPKAHLWVGGGDTLPSGRHFLPNIPTEEIFTTPDYLNVSGVVTTTRPVSVLDTIVKDVTLTFEEGRVVECKAKVGQDVMDRFLAIDEGAKYLGEVALVDESSPIAQSKRVFGSILYDENASCHLALGAGYPSTLKGSEALTNEKLLNAAGCNTSAVHTDFMVGSSDLTITAETPQGEVAIMEGGLFVI
ncbi:MAG: aminopeptidase [Spirochaetales bacterium]|nr:aminopeptidase [Spirochaetales bacterium]